MQSINVKLHSIIDVITNSSTELFITADKYAKETVIEFINEILKTAGSDKQCEDLFEVSLIRCMDNDEIEERIEDEFDSYREDIFYSNLSDEALKEKIKENILADIDEEYDPTIISIIPKEGTNPKLTQCINTLFVAEEFMR